MTVSATGLRDGAYDLCVADTERPLSVPNEVQACQQADRAVWGHMRCAPTYGGCLPAAPTPGCLP